MHKLPSEAAKRRRMLPRLYNKIPTKTYTSIMKKLERLRYKYPTYRDDELLVFMLCKIELAKKKDHD